MEDTPKLFVDGKTHTQRAHEAQNLPDVSLRNQIDQKACFIGKHLFAQ
jgi:hypothetical protein